MFRSSVLAVLWILVVGNALAEEVRIQNRTDQVFEYRIAFENSARWSQQHRMEPGGDYTLATSRPIQIRFGGPTIERVLILQPGSVYCFAVPNGTANLYRVPPTAVRKSAVASSAEENSRMDSQLPAGRAKGWNGEIRELKVLALADSPYRRFFSRWWHEDVARSWQDRVRLSIVGASNRFESEFGLRLKVHEIRPWYYRAIDMEWAQRWPELWKVDPGESDLVIGFTGLDRYEYDERGRRTHAVWGQSAHFGQYVLVADSFDYVLTRPSITLTHELGHVFGAFHVIDSRSIMQMDQGEIPQDFRFGDPERQAIQIGRMIDLAKGPSSLPIGDLKRLAELYREHHHPDEPGYADPVSLAYANRIVLAGVRKANETSSNKETVNSAAQTSPPPEQ